ncbi:MAG: ABC transporter substrate-binding protein [Victivallales bacterium]|nr:ABC transporter substrate-binding protein [Victivallales bacterium]
MKFHIGTILAAGAVVLVGLAGCRAQSGRDAGPRELRIGVIMPLTGSYAPYGKAVVCGMELYGEKFARQHPDLRLRLITVDNHSTAEGSLAAYRKLVQKDKVPVVVGAYTSANTFPLLPEVRKLKVPLITPTATHDGVTGHSPYVFRTCFNDSFQGEAMGRYLWRNVGIRKLGILWCLSADDGDYSRDLGRHVMSAFMENKPNRVKTVGYNIGQKDFSSQLRELKDAGVEAVFAPLYPVDLESFLPAAQAAGFLVFGSDSWSADGLLEKLGEAGDGCSYSCMFSPQYQKPQVAAFVNFVRDRGLDPGVCLAQGFDTAGILAAIMNPSSTAEDIAEALPEVRNYPGVTGPTSIYEHGRTTKNVFIVKIVWDSVNRRPVRTLEYIIEPKSE